MTDESEHASLEAFCRRQCAVQGGPVDFASYFESMKRLDCVVPLRKWPVPIVTAFTNHDFIDHRQRMTLWIFLAGNYGWFMPHGVLLNDVRTTLMHKLRDNAARRHMLQALPQYTKSTSAAKLVYYNATLGVYMTLVGLPATQHTTSAAANAADDENERRLYHVLC